MQFANLPAIKLADTLAEITPQKINQFTFVCDGSEALRLPSNRRHYHHGKGDKKRYKVISRRGAYHGVTGGALQALGVVLPMRQIMEPLPWNGLRRISLLLSCPFI